MKKFFEMPAIELTKFDVEDVITASSGIYTEEQFQKITNVDDVTSWNSDWNDSLMGI
jgi:hypothetical protein